MARSRRRLGNGAFPRCRGRTGPPPRRRRGTRSSAESRSGCPYLGVPLDTNDVLSRILGAARNLVVLAVRRDAVNARRSADTPARTSQPARRRACSACTRQPLDALVGQSTACLTSAPIRFSSAAVSSVSAKATGHMAPSSRFAWSLKPNVAYRSLNLCAGRKKQSTLSSLA